jgi:peroxiredoxin
MNRRGCRIMPTGTAACDKDQAAGIDLLPQGGLRMTIGVGDRLPEVKLRVMTAEGPAAKMTSELFGGKKVALFGVPGAFTGTCSNTHLPGFLKQADAFKAKGVDMIAVTGVNDVFVMEAWKRASGSEGKIEFIADGNGELANALGLTFDASGFGLGTRSKRYSMLLDNGVVKQLNVEESPGKVDVSGAEALLNQI